MKTERQRFRILHILPALGVGGAEVMATHLMVGLSQSHTMSAVALYPRRGALVERRLEAAGIQLHHLGKQPGLDLRMLPALRKVIVDFRPDVVHTHLSVLRYVYPVLLRHPVAVALHTLHNAAEREADTIGKMVQRVAFRRMVVPVAISQDGATTFKRVYGKECPTIIPNCVPVSEYQSAPETGSEWRAANRIPQDAVVFTCVGRLMDQKNPLGLLAAFSAVREERAHLVFLGNGGLYAQVESAIRTMALRGRVHLLGERDEVRECLAGSDVFTLSSRWEGSPLAVMEAMAAGLPVISTAVGGVPELVEDGREGIVVSPQDPALLGKAMQALASDAELRRSMGRAARNRADAEFGVETMTHKYEALYHRLLGAKLGVASASWNSDHAYIATPGKNEAP